MPLTWISSSLTQKDTSSTRSSWGMPAWSTTRRKPSRVLTYPEILKERIVSGHGHLSNKKSAIALAENFHEHLKHVWLCHLSEENNHPELARKTVETTLRSYGIIAGVDFSLEVLRRKIPTGPFQLGEMANCQFSLPFEG